MPVAECQPRTRAEMRRQNIKSVARNLFIEHGFHRTGIALIAKASGVAVQQLYRDFPAKEDIVAAIVEEDCKRLADIAALEFALSKNDRRAVRSWLISAACKRTAADDRLFLEIAAESARNERIKLIFDKAKLSMLNNIEAAFASLAGCPYIENSHRLAAEAYMIASFGSFCTHALHNDTTDAAIEKLLSCLIGN